MKLKIAICDDEMIMRNDLEKCLKLIDDKFIIKQYSYGERLLETDEDFDIYFLDVDMPVLNGIETAARLRQKKSSACIIFLTSHIEYVRVAFKVRAYRYLVKPIDKKELAEAIRDVERDIESKVYLSVKVGERVEHICLDDIILFEAFGDGTYVYKKDEVLTTTMTLKYWLDTVGETFFQTHRSYVVSLRHVKRINKTDLEMNYVDFPVPLSRRNKVSFKDAFFEYMRTDCSNE